MPSQIKEYDVFVIRIVYVSLLEVYSLLYFRFCSIVQDVKIYISDFNKILLSNFYIYILPFQYVQGFMCSLYMKYITSSDIDIIKASSYGKHTCSVFLWDFLIIHLGGAYIILSQFNIVIIDLHNPSSSEIYYYPFTYMSNKFHKNFRDRQHKKESTVKCYENMHYQYINEVSNSINTM
jgi:hypothetical protein